jgi:uncharacterized protein YbjT (DUF2867 family)
MRISRITGEPVLKWGDGGFFCRDLPSTPRTGMGKVLVTGASGYVGGRLVPELLARGYHVRVMVRAASPEYGERWADAEMVVADALRPEELTTALDGVHTAYYLIHSLLLGQKTFESADLCAAANFRRAAEEGGVKRIIYLGALGDVQAVLSPHLRSREKVARELSRGSVPTTILRAAVIIGSGSASYEIVEHLVKNLLVFPTPRWAQTRCQPIGIRDVVKYLVGALEEPATSGRSFDIGGADVLTYEEMLRVFADVLGVKRLFVRSPISNVRFLAYLASLITPVPAPITLSLFEGRADEVICLDNEIRRILPFKPLTYREAVVRAVAREREDRVHTRWSDSYPPAHELDSRLADLQVPPRYTSSHSLLTEKSAASLFRSVCSVGGRGGWFQSNWMWRVRGAFDRVFFGVGISRGRRSLSELRVGDVIDFWRVEELTRDRRLLLRAEMKMPGAAWLQFTIRPEEDVNHLSVEAFYEPRGLFGHAYWYAFLPFHHFIFRDLIEQIARRS